MYPPPQDIYIHFLKLVHVTLYDKKRGVGWKIFADVIKNLKMERLSELYNQIDPKYNRFLIKEKQRETTHREMVIWRQSKERFEDAGSDG